MIAHSPVARTMTPLIVLAGLGLAVFHVKTRRARVTPPTPEAVYLERSLAFLKDQRIGARIMKGKDFSGLYQSHKHTPRNPNSQYVAAYGRSWVYDCALGIYADLKSGKTEQARRGVDALVRLAEHEDKLGFRGLWHFSYNTMADDFIDPRGPLGANLWCLNAIYAYMLQTGDSRPLAWTNEKVAGFVFTQQVLDGKDPRYGLFRAGLENPVDLARGDAMGYHVYEGIPSDFDELLRESQRLSQEILGLVLPHPLNKPVATALEALRLARPTDEVINSQVEFCSIEHNADAVATLRLAARAAYRFLPVEREFLDELKRRHDLTLDALDRMWVREADGAGHFVTAMEADGTLNTSVAVDNNTWVPAVLLDYDEERVWESIQFTRTRFLVEDVGCKGLFFFNSDFTDRYVNLTEAEREEMERLIQPEATWGFVQLLWEYARKTKHSPRRKEALALARELAENMIAFQALYAATGDPYERGFASYADVSTQVGLSTLKAVAGEPRALLNKLVEESTAAANRHRRFGTPYASRNIRNYFNTLESAAATATGVAVMQVMRGANGDDFITVAPPRQWLPVESTR